MTANSSAPRYEQAMEVLIHLAPYLKKARVLQPSGRYGITISNFGRMLDFHDFEAVLYRVFPFSRHICTEDRDAIIWSAIRDQVNQPDFDADSLLQSLISAERTFLATRRNKFFLATFISIDQRGPRPGPRRYNESLIRFHGPMPASFTREKLPVGLSGLNAPLVPDRWCFVTVECQARSSSEAFYRGLKALNECRSIWNWFWSLTHGISMTFPTELPRNQYRIGPLHSVHNADHSLIETMFFHEQPYLCQRFPGDPSRLSQDWLGRLTRTERLVRANFRKISYRERLSELLSEYTAICDLPSSEGGFLRLWTLLENLTAAGAAGSSGSNDVLIKRAASVYKDRDGATILLRTLRAARNNSAHELKTQINIKSCFEQAIHIVDTMFRAHVDNAGRFKNIQEVGDYLQFATRSLNELNRVNSALDHAAALVRRRDGIADDYAI